MSIKTVCGSHMGNIYYSCDVSIIFSRECKERVIEYISRCGGVMENKNPLLAKLGWKAI